jgi:hypothetical protein
MDSFVPQATVHDNVKELRGYLGAHDHRGGRMALMPRDDLAALIVAEHPSRRLNGSSIQRWEEGTEPDLQSISIMAKLAGCTFEEFALGARSATVGGEPANITFRKEDFVRLTPQQVERARESAAAERRREAEKSPKKKPAQRGRRDR